VFRQAADGAGHSRADGHPGARPHGFAADRVACDRGPDSTRGQDPFVNFDTIFFAEPETFSRTITLLGQRVDIEAAPAQFTWIHGDGTSSSTETPGAPYPAKDVVHQYTDAHETVQTRVDVTYQARFSVNGGNWQAISEPVTISGPTDELRISEATAVLSGQYD